MIRDFVQERINALISAGERPATVDGYTFEEWDAICTEITRLEKCGCCTFDVWRSGIDKSYPHWRVKYPMLFPKE
jgi:hypothetical protein